MPTTSAAPFIIDDIVINTIASTSFTGSVSNDAKPVEEYSIEEEFEVVVQEVPGFKSITQATEPEALKKVHLEFLTQDDKTWQALMGLTNFAPHTLYCSALPETLLAYMTRRKVTHTHGNPDYTFTWEMEFIECNDNN